MKNSTISPGRSASSATSPTKPAAGAGGHGSQPSTGPIREHSLVLLFCLAAALRLVLYAAAFPFFTIADEPEHLDLVIRYAQGDIPRAVGPLAAESLPYVAAYATPEYLNPPEQYRPPPWTQPADQAMTNMVRLEAAVSHWQNFEASQPPLYYALAGLWWRVGQALGFHDLLLLYLLRFLNAPLLAATVCAGFIAARLVFPDSRFARLAVPALLAFVPQSAFYGVQNDVLSPLVFGGLFIGAVRWLQAERPGIGLGVATGLACAACYLTKISNLPLVLVGLGALGLKCWRLGWQGKLRDAAPAMLAFVVCTLVPIGLWVARTKHDFGDLTGSAAKMQVLGWTPKPFAEWWRHPIFTPRGAWIFLSGLLSTFWQEVFFWYAKPVKVPGVAVGYTLLSLGLLGVALWNLRKPAAPARLREALSLAALAFGAGVAFFALLSIPFDFGPCIFPSRAHPYFTAGRLLAGAWIPFALVFVYGWEQALSRFNSRKLPALAMAAFIVGLLLVEMAAAWPVFSSQYNLFHV